MEVVIILTALSIVGYLIYRSLPATKYKKGQVLLDSGDLIEATRLFDSIFYKHPESPAKLAECKFTAGLRSVEKSEHEAIRLFEEVIAIKERLKGNSNRELYECVESKAALEIAILKFISITRGSLASDMIKQVKDNISFIDAATKRGVESEFANLKKDHFSKLAEINFNFGKQEEKSERFVEAINYYLIAKDFSSKSSDPSIQYNFLARVAIATLKNKGNIIKTIAFNDIDKSEIEYKRDFFYRYAKRLVQERKLSEAQRIIDSRLNFASHAIDRLKALVNTMKIKEAIKRVREINYHLEQLYENSFPPDDVRNLYENLDEKIQEIGTVLPSLIDKLQPLKPSLFNRLLLHYISERQFGNGINLIQKFPQFWDSPELLKNLGICCYNFAAQGHLTEKNYRTVISNWLTVVFTDGVILKSLEGTNWDDEYTFTLSESLGSRSSGDSNLPANVNFDPVTDTNISIGATQRELLFQFEEILNKTNLESSFFQDLSQFYKEEKHSIELVTSVVNGKMFLASPQFAKSYGLNSMIIQELGNYYSRSHNEEFLEAGIPYLKDSSKSLVWEFASAKDLEGKLIGAIKNKRLKEIKAVIAEDNKGLVKYKRLGMSVANQIYSVFAAEIELDEESEELIPLMRACLLLPMHNDKLRFQFSNFVANFCIAKVNADQLDNFKALNLMKEAYFYSSDNSKICKNIVTLIRFNLMDILNDKTRMAEDIYRTLDEIYLKRSGTFLQESSELSQTRTDILAQIKGSGGDISLLANDDPFIGVVLGDYRLTNEGRKLKKVLSYFNKLSDSSSLLRPTSLRGLK